MYVYVYIRVDSGYTQTFNYMHVVGIREFLQVTYMYVCMWHSEGVWYYIPLSKMKIDSSG